MANRVTPIRPNLMQPAAPYSWNGRQWVPNPQCPPTDWDDGCCGQGPPPGCAPCPTPPTCFSSVAKANECWDQSQALYDLVTKVVQDIFTKNPGIIPPPPPSAGSGPIIGVTDGSDAAPGEVGEWLTFPSSGTVAVGSSASYTAIPALPPGDWDVWCILQIIIPNPDYYTSIVNTLSVGGNQIGEAQLAGNWASPYGLGNSNLNMAQGRVNTATPVPVMGNITMEGYLTTPPLPFTCTTNARRRR